MFVGVLVGCVMCILLIMACAKERLDHQETALNTINNQQHVTMKYMYRNTSSEKIWKKKKKNSFTKKYVLNHVLFLYLRYFSVFTVFFKCQSYFSNKTSYIVLSNKPLVECFKSYAILGLASK